MPKAGVKEWYGCCQQEDYRITTWAISKREAAHLMAVKDSIRLMLNWRKAHWAPVAEMWCTCPCGGSGFDSPCHLLVSKTSSANKVLLRFEKQLGSAWELLAALAAVLRVHEAHTIGPGTAASATLSIWLSVPHPMLCRFCFCWQKLFSQCQKMSQSLQCKMIFFTSLTFLWQLAGFAGFTLRVKLLPETPNSQTLKNQWARHSESSGISCFITYHTAYNGFWKKETNTGIHKPTQNYGSSTFWRADILGNLTMRLPALWPDLINTEVTR